MKLIRAKTIADMRQIVWNAPPLDPKIHSENKTMRALPVSIADRVKASLFACLFTVPAMKSASAAISRPDTSNALRQEMSETDAGNLLDLGAGR